MTNSFVLYALKEIDDRITMSSILKGVENFRNELTKLYNEASIKYGLIPEEKLQLQQDLYRIYGIRI